MSTLGILSLMGKLLPSAYSTSMPHAGATIILLDLHLWTYSSEFPAALTKSARKSGDVLLATMLDHLMEIKLKRTWRPIIKLKKRWRHKWRTPMDVKVHLKGLQEACSKLWELEDIYFLFL